jgi:hypothetical protein
MTISGFLPAQEMVPISAIMTPVSMMVAVLL